MSDVKTCAHCGQTIKPKKNSRFIPNYDFILDIEMTFVFEMWCKGKSKKYKNQIQVEAGFNKLLKLSNGNPAIATEIVENSLAANWEGLFPLKNRTDAAPKKEEDNRSSFQKMQEKYGR